MASHIIALCSINRPPLPNRHTAQSGFTQSDSSICLIRVAPDSIAYQLPKSWSKLQLPCCNPSHKPPRTPHSVDLTLTVSSLLHDKGDKNDRSTPCLLAPAPVPPRAIMASAAAESSPATPCPSRGPSACPRTSCCSTSTLQPHECEQQWQQWA